MVRVLRFFNFRSSVPKQTADKPECLAAGKNNFVFIGTDKSTIQVFRKKSIHAKTEWDEYCSFQTGAHVSHIEYNESGDYISTIERKSNRMTEVVSVKVYLNWHIAATDSQFRTRVRVAGLGYRSNNVQTGERLEVVDVPCEKNATCLASCQQTGNLGITCDNHVKLYHLVEKTIPNSQTTYLDVILFLQLQFNHPVSYIDVCEDYLACSSSEFVQVFQVNVSNDVEHKSSSIMSELDHDSTSPNKVNRRSSSVHSSLNIHNNLKASSPSSLFKSRSKMNMRGVTKFSAVGERSSSTPSPALKMSSSITCSAIEDDTDFIHWTFPDQLAMLHGNTNNETVQLKGLVNLGKQEKLEPRLPEVNDYRGGSHLSTGETSLTQIFYEYLDRSDSSWIHLQLIPTYLIGKNEAVSLTGSGAIVNSNRRSSLVGMSCFVSGHRVGYMVSLLPQPVVLSTYKYSSDALQIQTNGRLLYVLSENGLEVYTTRCGMAAIHNIEQFDHVTKTTPTPDVDICMCGVQQFLGPRKLALTDRFVILYNQVENAWNVNIMEEPTVTEFYQDMLRFGERYQQNAPDTYHHMLLECHMMLTSCLIGQSIDQSGASIIEDLLHESSALLGDYYALPDCPSWHLCLPYYTMSGLDISDIVRQAVQHKLHSKQVSIYGQGLVQYLNYVLFLDDDPLDIKQTVGDMLLEVCQDSMPEKLADIILFSRLQNYTPEIALKLLKSSSKSRALLDTKTKTKESLAYVALNLQLCEPEVAASTLSVIDKKDLVQACVDNHQMLCAAMTEFSTMSQLIRSHCPTILIQILVLLHDKGTMSMDRAINLLQGKSGIPEIHRNTHVREYLEMLVNDDSRKLSFDEAVPQLCDIYLQRLAEWESPSIRQLTPSLKFTLPNGSGHFGRRHVWLDNLPPFSGARSITSTCKYVVHVSGRRPGIQSQQLLQCQKTDETCSCFLCNEDLLKLQALLCYTDISNIICEKVLTSLQTHQGVFYYDSISILCLIKIDIKQAIEIVASKNSNIAAEFGAAVIKDNSEMWRILLNCLLSRVEKKAGTMTDQTESSVPVQVVKDVLQEMAHHLKPDVFLHLLPGNGNFFFFLPYIQLSIETLKCNKLKDKILTIGETMSEKTGKE